MRLARSKGALTTFVPVDQRLRLSALDLELVVQRDSGLSVASGGKRVRSETDDAVDAELLNRARLSLSRKHP